MTGKRSLIIFSKYPDRNVKTRLKGYLDEDERIRFYEKMLKNTIYELRDMKDVDVSICYTPFNKVDYFSQYGLTLFPQTNGDLGKRMFNAFRTVLDNGYAQVILVGTDIPKLSKRIVLDAFRSLNRNDMVLGPATDGGYYLIGLINNCPTIFQNIYWSAPDTLEQTIKKAKEEGLSIGYVKKLSDIDTIEDMKKEGLLH